MNTGVGDATIVIRALRRSDDYSDLVELMKEFYKEYEAHHELYATDHINEREIKKFFLDAVKHRDEEAFVATDNGKIIGFILLSIEQRVPTFYRIKQIGLISIMMVDRARRKSGIGDKLLKRAKVWLKMRGIEYVYLETAPKNRTAMIFYLKEGFRSVHLQLISKV